MSHILALVATLALVSGATADIKSNCDAVKFVACQNKFTNALGIDNSYNWQDPNGLLAQIQAIYAKGTTKNPQTKGLVSVCNAYNDMLDCLNDNAFTAFECFDPLFLLSADSNPINAYSYASVMNMVQYQCGAGFYPAIDNWACLQKIYVADNTQLNKCLNTFQISQMNDPENSCRYVFQGMNCWAKVMQTCSASTKYYGCESFRQYVAPQFAACNEQCTV